VDRELTPRAGRQPRPEGRRNTAKVPRRGDRGHDRHPAGPAFNACRVSPRPARHCSRRLGGHAV